MSASEGCGADGLVLPQRSDEGCVHSLARYLPKASRMLGTALYPPGTATQKVIVPTAQKLITH